MTRGMNTIQALYSRSVRASNGTCWLWQGAVSDNLPRIWTFDHDRGEKRCMSGPAAVWNIAFGQGTRGGWAYRCCGAALCVCPAHVRLAPNRKAMFAALKADGRWKGTHIEARRKSIKHAHAVNGIIATPDDVVLAIRAEGDEPTNIALAAIYGVSHSTISNIRRGKSHRALLEATA